MTPELTRHLHIRKHLQRYEMLSIPTIIFMQCYLFLFAWELYIKSQVQGTTCIVIAILWYIQENATYFL